MPNDNANETTTALTRDLLKEKRADRRWRNLRFLCWFILFAYLIFNLLHLNTPSTSEATGKYVAFIRLDGMIAPGRTFSSENLIPILQQAYRDKGAAGVIIDINSPGGTPVQASIIHDAIIRFKNKYHKKTIVVGEDLLTSGAYYVASAADEIYVNPSTLTGSVGVIMEGFGFVDLMKKIGVERRVYTAGDEKDRLDPFLPQSPQDIEKIKQVMAEVHQHFINAVLASRKNRLHANTQTLFNGDFWSGETALKLGLVDHLGNVMDASSEEFNTTNTKEYGGSTLLRLFSGRLSSTFDTLLYS